MQFTGLHADGENFGVEDKEIFEHDILEVEYEGEKVVCEVMYEAGGTLLASDHFEDGYIWASELVECEGRYCWIGGSKVLGNKYQHPHLLKGVVEDA
ncbi:hypothetical protein FLT15_17815 [Paenibacillus thiaminolyticus]|nr:YopX family protein [Paenibacillus thiaminolyticus]NGP60000.1 hypothetical protein [Paenibacillus thiaminolyticus]NGP60115.1 hypothetical protein [Paenibacillus thiaminolyticus]